MCGIAGILYKTEKSGDSQPAIGTTLRNMLYAMRHRGVDSTGVTISGQHFDAEYVLRVFFSKGVGDPVKVNEALNSQIRACGGEVRFLKNSGAFCRIGFDYSGDLRRLSDAVLEV